MNRPHRSQRKDATSRTPGVRSEIIRREGHRVKGIIVGDGIKLGDLARAAKISQPHLSNHLAGIRADRNTQAAIWDAWCELSGRTDIGLRRFWGPMLAKRKAG